jgi:hypothetical protein
MPHFELRIIWSKCHATYVGLALFASTLVALAYCWPRHREGDLLQFEPPPMVFAEALPAADGDDDAQDFGWAGPDAVADLAEWANAQPQFQLIDETGSPVWQDNSSADVRLWQLIAHSGGEYPSADHQLTGDCTAWGATHALMGTQGGQASRGDPIEVKRPSPLGLYAARVDVWAPQIGGVRRLPAAGCTGAAVARMAQQFGVLFDDTPGLPSYSRAEADRWGRQGMPEQFRDIAARHKVRTVARITTVDEARDAICNYYGCTIASPWGNPRHQYKRQDGRWVAQRTGTWMHQMCIDGYDGRFATKYFHVTNSWPKSQHPAPIDDSPAGGFWITAAELAWILRHNDSWAFSDFQGFPARNRELDFSPLRPRRDAPPRKGSVF